MSTVVNKHTFQVIRSANTALYRNGDWWINPVLPTEPQRYWKNNTETDTLEAHNSAGQDSIDQGNTLQRKYARTKEVEVELNDVIERAYWPHAQRQLMLLLILANDEGHAETKGYILPLVGWIANGQKLMTEAQERIEAATTEIDVDAAGYDYEAFALWHQTQPDVQPMIAQGIFNG